jgi:hypothetical protein
MLGPLFSRPDMPICLPGNQLIYCSWPIARQEQNCQGLFQTFCSRINLGLSPACSDSAGIIQPASPWHKTCPPVGKIYGMQPKGSYKQATKRRY